MTRKTTATLAKEADALYRIEIEPATYIRFGDRDSGVGRGFRAVVRWGDDPNPAWRSSSIYDDDRGNMGRRMRFEANLKKGEMERYFLATGKRWEIVRAEEWAAKQAKEKAMSDARQALIADRVAIYDSLSDLAEIVETALDAGLFLSVDGKRPDLVTLDRTKALLEKHAVAVADIKAKRKEKEKAA